VAELARLGEQLQQAPGSADAAKKKKRRDQLIATIEGARNDIVALSTQELEYEKESIPIQLQQASAEIESFRAKVESELSEEGVGLPLGKSAGQVLEGVGEAFGFLIVAGVGKAIEVILEFFERRHERHRAVLTQQWREIEQRLLARVEVWDQGVTRTFDYYVAQSRKALAQFSSGGDCAQLRASLDLEFEEWERLQEQATELLLVEPLQKAIEDTEKRLHDHSAPTDAHQRGTAKERYTQPVPAKINAAPVAVAAPGTWLGQKYCGGFDAMRDRVHALQAEIAANPGDAARKKELEELDESLTGQLNAIVESGGRAMLTQEQVFPSVMDDIARVVEEFANSIDEQFVPGFPNKVELVRGVALPPATGALYTFGLPVSFEENRILDSSGENEAPPTDTVAMNCSMVYCFLGPAATVSGTSVLDKSSAKPKARRGVDMMFVTS
jgi:hypothetical protein